MAVPVADAIPGDAGGRRPTLHVIGVFYTVTSPRYSADAFTTKTLLVPRMLRPFGWRVIEYGNGESTSEADQHVMLLSEDELVRLRQCKSETEVVIDRRDSTLGTPLWKAFNRRLLHHMRKHARPGDIVLHMLPGAHDETMRVLDRCFHVDMGIGCYMTSAPFKIFESRAWQSWVAGAAQRKTGNNFHWVVPIGYDLDEWDVCVRPDEGRGGGYVLFYGRLVSDKGLPTVVEVARRTPYRVMMCGPGDPKPWQKECARLEYHAPVVGRARSPLVGQARCLLMPTDYIEPFGSVVAEALLCGVPVLTTNHGGPPEQIEHGVDGFRCTTLGDWLDAIEAVETLDRAAIAERARRRYSLAAVGERIDTHLRQVADQGGKGWYTTHSYDLQGRLARALRAQRANVNANANATTGATSATAVSADAPGTTTVSVAHVAPPPSPPPGAALATDDGACASAGSDS